jgi:YbbR domain-containing protein
VAGAGPGQLSAKVDIHLQDAQGNEITYANVTKNTNAIMTTVEVHATEEIPVEYQYMGMPAEGYLETGVFDVTPQTVRIAGTTTALNRINKIVIPKTEIDITGATGNLEQVIDLKNYLPNGVYFADSSFDGKAYVTVFVEAVAEKKIPLDKEKITVMNIPEGYAITFPENINMPTATLYGLQAQLDAIKSLGGTVDITAWLESQAVEEISPGLHAVPVEVSVPEGFEMSDEVSVYIELTAIQSVGAEGQTESAGQ